ncbi:Transthyretin-like family protein [Cooperia oncophora]
MLWKLLCLITLLFMDVSCRSVAVKGNLKCGKYPAGQILVRLWDSSRVEGTTDKLIDQTHSDSDGNFKLTAHGSLKNGWQPILSVHHDCDDAKNTGRRMLKFRLPKSYIEDDLEHSRKHLIWESSTWKLISLKARKEWSKSPEEDDIVPELTDQLIAIAIAPPLLNHLINLIRMILLTKFLLLCAVFGFSFAFRKQGVAVKGRLMCGEKPLRNAKVEIYDLDRNPGDPDDLLDENFSDKDGRFALTGTTRELTDIEPVLYIYHDCEDGIRPCQKRITIDVPKRYIHRGTPSAWMDVGTMELSMTYPNEDRSCKN